MKLNTADIAKEIPLTLSPVLQVSPVPNTGFDLWISNLSTVNGLTYKIQDSDDGLTWFDRTFATGDISVTASVFALSSATSVSINLVYVRTYTRLVACAPASTMAQIKVVWANASEEPVTYIQS